MRPKASCPRANRAGQNENRNMNKSPKPLPPSTLKHQPSTAMKLTSFTCFAFLINRVIDAGPDADLSYEEIFDAAGEGRLISLLAQRYGQNNAFRSEERRVGKKCR